MQMSQSNDHTDELQAAPERIRFPDDFLRAYDLAEHLSSGRDTETYLAFKKGCPSPDVVKCYDLRCHGVVHEHDILRGLRHPGLPAYREEFANGDALCVVREYVQGRTLDQYARENKLDEAAAVRFCVQLCDILTYLHCQAPPVIHRDIKPQNLIVREDGSIVLIDFDISRRFDDGADSDTVAAGTRQFASPEQYGFSQTDARTDIYALGVLLRWMLTGSTDAASEKVTSRPLARIVRRCAAFSPDERYASARAVKEALLRAARPWGRIALRRLLSAAALCACLCAGFLVGRYTSLFSPLPSAPALSFREPLIERAVRLQLGLDENAALSANDLLAVRNLYIFGNEASLTPSAFRNGLSGQSASLPRGSIMSVEDLRLLPNLEDVMIAYQKLSDISAVASLKRLTTLSLIHTRVSDLAPLQGLVRLTSLNLFDTLVTDASVLDGCVNLRCLNIGGTLIASLGDAGGSASLTELTISKLQLTDLSPLTGFPSLTALDMQESVIGDVAALRDIPALKQVTADAALCQQIAERIENPSFQILTR